MAAVYGYLIACILSSFILGGLAGAPQCVQDELPNLQSCTSTFMSVIADMIGNAQSPPDQKAIMGAICSTEGKAAMMCSYQVMERCPALAQSGGGMGMIVPGVNMSEVMAMGGMDVMCGMMSDDCSGVQQCFSMMGGPQGGMMEGNGGGSTPQPDAMDMIMRYMTTQPGAFNEAKSYLFFQGQVGMVCGSLKPVLDCVYMAVEKCPAMKEQIDKQMTDMMKQLVTTSEVPAGVKIMTFKEQQDFIKNGCPKIPEGFAQNKCLPDQLMSSDFTKCHKNFSATYKNKADIQMGDKNKCGATVFLQNCFKEYVQPACGDSISSLMVTNLPLMVDGLDGQGVQQCFSMMGGPQGGMMEGNGGGSTPQPDAMEMIMRYMTTQPGAFNEAKSYLFFQGQVGMVCGILKPVMDCVYMAVEKCPAMKEQIDKQMTDMMKQLATTSEIPAGVKIMTFKEQQDFIKNGCPKIPEGFAQNKCLPDQLMSSDFTKCHKNFSATYKNKADIQMGDKNKCGATVFLQNCFKEYVQPACGDSISSLMVTNLPLMVDGLDGQCSQYTSGSNTPMAGVAMLLMAAVTLMAAALL